MQDLLFSHLGVDTVTSAGLEGADTLEAPPTDDLRENGKFNTYVL